MGLVVPSRSFGRAWRVWRWLCGLPHRIKEGPLWAGRPGALGVSIQVRKGGPVSNSAYGACGLSAVHYRVLNFVISFVCGLLSNPGPRNLNPAVPAALPPGPRAQMLSFLIAAVAQPVDYLQCIIWLFLQFLPCTTSKPPPAAPQLQSWKRMIAILT